jgi:hypothetical protein
MCTSAIRPLPSSGAVEEASMPRPPSLAGSVGDPVSRIVMLFLVAAGMMGRLAAASPAKTFGMRWILPSRWRIVRKPPSATAPTTAISEATVISAILRARRLRFGGRSGAEVASRSAAADSAGIASSR